MLPQRIPMIYLNQRTMGNKSGARYSISLSHIKIGKPKKKDSIAWNDVVGWGSWKIKKNEIHLIALGFCHPISVTQRRQQQKVYGLYFIGRWMGSAFVTSWLALLLLWVSRFCADGRPPAYLRDDPSSHHLPAVCLYWIRIHQIWDSRAERPIV